MSQKLLEEIEHELEASTKFTRMSIYFNLMGLPHASQYFMKVAQEDMHHAGRYAQIYEQVTGEIPQINGLSFSKDIYEKIIEQYEQMEAGGVKRISAIKDTIDEKTHPGVLNELDEFAGEHEQEQYKARKIKQRIATMSNGDKNLHDIDEFFEEIMEGDVDGYFNMLDQK